MAVVAGKLYIGIFFSRKNNATAVHTSLEMLPGEHERLHSSNTVTLHCTMSRGVLATLPGPTVIARFLHNNVRISAGVGKVAFIEGM